MVHGPHEVVAVKIMPKYIQVLVVLILLVVLYELVALNGAYPTITSTVASLPLGWVLVIAAGLIVLAIHFIRAHDRNKEAK